MGKKRGGLAGIWDRNKKVIKPLATAAAGFLTGGAALPALLGAGMSGFDREGKSGIGFDAKKGVMGGIEGYGMGRLGAGLGKTAIGQKLGGGSLRNAFANTGSAATAGAGTGSAATAGAGQMPTPGGFQGVGATPYGQPVGVGIGVEAPVGGVPESILGAPTQPGALSLANAPKPVGSAVPKTSPFNTAVAPPQTFGDKVKSAGSSVLGSVGNHPEAWAQGLGAAAKFATAGSENRQNDAASRLTAAQAAQAEYDMERKKKSDIALESIRQQLAQQMMDSARNPYTPFKP